MIKEIPDVIYDSEGNLIRVIKASKVFFSNKGRMGYVLHIEKEERITSISEFELTEEKGKYILTRNMLKVSYEL